MASDEEFDPFAFSSGFIDDVDIEVLDAYFAFDTEYNNGQTLRLSLDVMTDDEDFGEMGRGVLRPYPCGDGWTAEDKGAVAVREDGAQKTFNRNASIAKLVSAMLDCDGVEDVLRSEGRGDPRKASTYIGLKFHMKNKEFDYGGEIGKRDLLLPTDFLGVSGGPAPKGAPAKKAAAPSVPASKSAPTPTNAPAKKAPPTKAAAPKAAERTVPPTFDLTEGSELYTQIYNIAWNAENREKFIEACYEQIDGIADSDIIAEFVLDEGDEGLWAKVVADYEAQS